MFKAIRLFIFCALATTGSAFAFPVLAVTDSVDVTLSVTASCNNDGACTGNETVSNCASDCSEETPKPPSTGDRDEVCTDRTAQNYGALGLCVYAVQGCTDRGALNYQAIATRDDGSCRFIFGVENFTAQGDSKTKTASLSWDNPVNRAGFNFDRVRIIRTPTLPSGPTDGVLVYEGRGTTALDEGLILDTRYYYAAYVYSRAGDVSSPAIASVLLQHGDEEGTEPTDVFETFPSIPGGPSSPTFTIEVIQGSSIKLFGDNVGVRSDTPVTFSIDYTHLPEVLKTIGVTIYNTENTQQTSSFILHMDRATRAYRATVGTLSRPGRYPVTVHVFDYENRRLQKIHGHLVVSTSTVPLALRIATTVAVPFVVTGGAVAGLAQGLLAVSNVRSFYDLYLLSLRLIGALLGAFGLRRRHAPWGTVYDAITKRPLDPAYVSALRWDKEYKSVITDIDGRFGFLLPPGTYTLSANKTHYQFPSARLRGRSEDEFYDKLYFGEEIIVGEGELVSRNIPMDPIGFDWNEFVKNKSKFVKYHSRREQLRLRIFNTLYVLGFSTACITLIVSPAWFNVGVVAVYCGIFVSTLYWRGRHKVVSVRNSQTGEPVPFAIIRFSIPGVADTVSKVVSDELGRFYQLLRPGDYKVSVEELQGDGSYKKVFTSEVIHMPTGMLLNDLEFTPN